MCIRDSPDSAQEQHDRAGGVVTDRFGQLMGVDRIVGQSDHGTMLWCRYVSLQPPLTGGKQTTVSPAATVNESSA